MERLIGFLQLVLMITLTLKYGVVAFLASAAFVLIASCVGISQR